jgi:hypothetical protein
MTISQFYNYIFYITLIGMNWLSNNFIIIPLIWIMKLLPIPEKRVKLVEKWHLTPQKNPDKNGDAHWAYRWMLWSLTWVIILLMTPLRLHSGLNLIAILVVAGLTSIIFNETILWRKEKYKTHFKKFNKQQIPKSLIFVTTIFHLIPFVCLGLLIKQNN